MSLMDIARGAYVRSPSLVRRSLAPLVSLIPTRTKFGPAYQSWRQRIAAAAADPALSDAEHRKALRALLKTAHAGSPFYRDLLDKALGTGFDFDSFGPADLARLPVLTKADLREAGDAALTVPRSFRLAQIFIAEEPGADKKLKTIQQRLKDNPASFGKVAGEMSEEKESASRDGEIGWLSERQIQPEILAQLPKLKVNTVSTPVQLKDGWHILKVLDVREPFTPIFDQVRVQLAQRLRAEKSSANIQAYVSEVLQRHPVAINEVALSKLLQNTPSPAAGVNP